MKAEEIAKAASVCFFVQEQRKSTQQKIQTGWSGGKLRSGDRFVRDSGRATDAPEPPAKIKTKLPLHTSSGQIKSGEKGRSGFSMTVTRYLCGVILSNYLNEGGGDTARFRDDNACPLFFLRRGWLCDVPVPFDGDRPKHARGWCKWEKESEGWFESQLKQSVSCSWCSTSCYEGAGYCFFRKQVGMEVLRDLPLAGDRRVPGHRFRRHFEIAVRPIQEALPALREVLEHQTGGGRSGPVEGTPAGTSPIFNVETEKTQTNYQWGVRRGEDSLSSRYKVGISAFNVERPPVLQVDRHVRQVKIKCLCKLNLPSANRSVIADKIKS